MNGGGRSGGLGAWCALAVVLGAACGSVTGEEAVPQDLARLVPPSVVVFVRGRDLAGLWKEAEEGAFVQRLKQTQLWQRFVTSDDYLKMVDARNALLRRYEIDVERTMLDVIGREAVLAETLEPKPGGGHRPVFHLLAARATSADRLTAIADTLRRVRTETEELKSAFQHPYRGHVIHQDVTVPRHGRHAGRERTLYYCLAGEILLAGRQIGPVKAAIDRLLEPGKPSLADSERYRQAMSLLPAGCPVTAYVDGTVLTASGNLAADQVGEGAEAPLRGLLGGGRGPLSAVDAVALGLRTRPAVQVLVRTRVKTGDLDAATAELLRGRGAAHAAWSLLPASTIAALSVRTDAAALAAFVRARLLGPAAAAQFDLVKQGLSGALGGMDFEREILKSLGPELAVVVSRLAVPERAGQANTLRGLAGTVLIQAGEDGNVDTRLLTALGTFAWAAVTGNNNNPQKPKLVLGVDRVGAVPVTYVDFVEDHPLKGTLSPCCAKVGAFVAVSTSRAALADLIKASAGGAALTGSAAFKRHLELGGNQPDALLYLDAAQLAAALHENREVLIAGRKKEKTEEQARADLSALIELLGLIEAVSVTRTHAPDRVSASVTVTAPPTAPQ